MKKLLFLGMISLTLFGCQKAAESAPAKSPDQVENKANNAKAETETPPTTPAAEEKAANTSESKRNSPGSIDLAGMVDMTVEETLEIDHMRERVGKESWGDILSILKTSGATFEKAGTCCIVAQGETKRNGFAWAAELILDLDQDAVFGVQWDGENKRIDQFEDDKEGLDTPQPMIDFTTQYNQ